jgi:hypothetical protein
VFKKLRGPLGSRSYNMTLPRVAVLDSSTGPQCHLVTVSGHRLLPEKTRDLRQRRASLLPHEVVAHISFMSMDLCLYSLVLEEVMT